MRVFLFLAILLSACATKSAPSAPTPPLQKLIPWDQYATSVILKTYRGENVFICSAVLISKNRGLTTAHCISKSDRNEVVVGVSLTDPALKTLAVDQKSIRIHPKYRPAKSLSDSDLAVFELKDAASFTQYPKIPDENEIKLAQPQSLSRVGFGLRNGANSRTWTEVFFDRVEPRRLYVKDTLSVIGDSGSPIYFNAVNKSATNETASTQLIGIHSTLVESGHVAAVYLPDFKKWIFKNKTAGL